MIALVVEFAVSVTNTLLWNNDKIRSKYNYSLLNDNATRIKNDNAKQMEKEIGVKWNKGSYTLGLNEAPPTRLLALQIALSSWIGWIMQQKHGKNNHVLSSADCWNRIEEAYKYGVNLSINEETPQVGVNYVFRLFIKKTRFIVLVCHLYLIPSLLESHQHYLLCMI